MKLVSWPIMTYKWPKRDAVTKQNLLNTQELKCNVRFAFKGLAWDYDSNFQEIKKDGEANQTFKGDTPFPISELPFYPLQLAPESIRKALVERGRMYWKCRRQRYVQYSGNDLEMVKHQVSKYRKMYSTRALGNWLTEDAIARNSLHG